MNRDAIAAIHASSRSWGHIPDPASRRLQKDARLLFAPSLTLISRASLPKSASLAHFAAPTFDQGSGSEGTGSCYGHGCAQLHWESFGSIGEPLPWVPSPGGVYKLARIWDRPPAPEGMDPEPLRDVGSMPSSGSAAQGKWGISPMTMAKTPDGRVSDVTVANCNGEPDFLTLEQGALKVVSGEYRADESAPDVIEQICATNAGYNGQTPFPVGIGCFVDRNFQDWTPSQGPLDKVDLADPDGGGHWVCEDAFDTSLIGGIRVFSILNSWGTWGNNGRIEVTENWVRRAVTDIYPWKVRRMQVAA
jgi:hypothetical protein